MLSNSTLNFTFHPHIHAKIHKEAFPLLPFRDRIIGPLLGSWKVPVGRGSGFGGFGVNLGAYRRESKPVTGETGFWFML
jgi:hypothetical protein